MPRTRDLAIFVPTTTTTTTTDGQTDCFTPCACAEPKNADDCARSFAAGQRFGNETPPDTICDALKMSLTGLI